MLDLDVQRLLFFDRQHLEIDFLPFMHGEGHRLLPAVIERDVLARLEEAQLADALGRDTARGEIGDTARGESKANVGDVDLSGEDGDTGGANLLGGCADQVKHDIEIVDHEIEHDVDVEAAR